MAKTTTAQTTIGDLFEHKVHMPEYQREFAWRVDIAASLFDSIHEHLEMHDQKLPDHNPFYLGSMISIGDGEFVGNAPIVDGQQRLTSLQMLSALVRDYAINRKRYKGAFALDREFVWKIASPAGHNNFTGGGMRVIPRDSGVGVLNPRESLLWISSLEFEYPEQIEVTTEVHHGGGNYTIEVEEIGGNPFIAPWELGVGLEIEFPEWTLKVTQAISQGAAATSLKGVVTGPATPSAGDRATLKVGVKNGASPPSDRRTRLWKAHSELEEYVRNKLDGWYPRGLPATAGVVWLDSLEKYLEQLRLLLVKSTVSMAKFVKAGEAMKYFLIVNDSSKRENLLALDMLRATMRRVIDEPSVAGTSSAQNTTSNGHIETQFQILENMLWTSKDKDPNFSRDFFYYFLIANNNLDANGVRYDKDDTFSGLYSHYLAPLTTVGSWAKKKVVKLLKDLNLFASAMQRALYDWSVYGVIPLAHEHDEEFYLRVLKDCPYMQWLTVYMVGRVKMQVALRSASSFNNTHYDTQMSRLLKGLAYVHVAGQLLPAMCKEEMSRRSPQNVWGRCLSWNAAIGALPNNASDAGVRGAIDWVINDINTWFGVGPAITYATTASASTVHPDVLTSRYKANNTQARTVLQLLEWDWSSSKGVVTAENKFIPNSATTLFQLEVEHIQPRKTPVGVGFPWGDYDAADSDEWGDIKDQLGNRLLIVKRENKHLGNNQFGWKKSLATCAGPCHGNWHYDNLAGRHSNVNHWWRKYAGKATWGQTEVDEWEEYILGELVRVLPRPS